MNNKFLSHILFSCLLFLLSACEINNDEDVEIMVRNMEEYLPSHSGMDCGLPISIQPPFHCIYSQNGGVLLGDYSSKYNLQGSWTNNSNICFSLQTNGTGIFKTRESNGNIRTNSIKWGIVVNPDGIPQTYGDNNVFLYIGSTEFDPSLNFIEYNLTNSKIMSAGLVRGNCNF